MKPIILSVIIFAFIWLATNPQIAFGQTQSIKLPKDKKVVLKGQIRKGGERLYTFEARTGQTLSVKLVSLNNNAVFSVNLQDRIEYESIETGKTAWSGRLPESDSGIYSIAVRSANKPVQYQLTVTLH